MQFSYPEKQNPTLYALNAVAEEYPNILVRLFYFSLIDKRYAKNGTGFLTGFTGGYTVSMKVNPAHTRHDIRINLAAAQSFSGGPATFFGAV